MLKPVNNAARNTETIVCACTSCDPKDVCVLCDVRDGCAACDSEFCLPLIADVD